MNQFIPISPTPKQTAFLMLPHKEALYGGAAGGGKSWVLLAAALQFADCPGYDALILRRTYQQLAKPGALIDIALSWLSPFREDGVRWKPKDYQWVFPSGATLSFGHAQYEHSVHEYQGAAWNFIGIDEATQFTEKMYTYFFSRLRKPAESPFPSRFRATANPGGIGHLFVKRRFNINKRGDPAPAGRVYLPAKANDNPYLDQEDYAKQLAELDPLARKWYEEGDWDALAGGLFRQEWLGYFEPRRNDFGPYYLCPGGPVSPRECLHFLAVDAAVSEKESADWTAISHFALTPDRTLLWVDCDLAKIQGAHVPARVKAALDFTGASFALVEANGPQVVIYQALKNAGLPVQSVSPGVRDKRARSVPAAIAVEQSRVLLNAHMPKRGEVEGQLVTFTGEDGREDDACDTLFYAVEYTQKRGVLAQTAGPRYKPPTDAKFHRPLPWENKGHSQAPQGTPRLILGKSAFPKLITHRRD